MTSQCVECVKEYTKSVAELGETFGRCAKCWRRFSDAWGHGYVFVRKPRNARQVRAANIVSRNMGPTAASGIWSCKLIKRSVRWYARLAAGEKR